MGSLSCSICKDYKVECDTETRCKHKFHKSCLEKWLVNGNEKCPFCGWNVFKYENILSEQSYENVTLLSDEEKKEFLNFSIKDKNTKLFKFLVEYFENCKIRDFDKFNLVYNA